MLDGTEFFECDCGSEEHTLRFTLELDNVPEGAVLYTTIFLNNWQHWYQRVWIAIKYIFGYKCKYGHWDSWNLRKQDAKRLQSLLEKVIKFETEND